LYAGVLNGDDVEFFNTYLDPNNELPVINNSKTAVASEE
jgi:hypothetical protein